MSASLNRTVPQRVVKVGGSLFVWPELPAELKRWLEQQPGHSVLLAGGGELAEAVRRADALYGWGEVRSHWLCIDAMGITAQMLATIVRADPPIADFDEVQRHVVAGQPGWCIIDPREFLRKVEPHLSGAVLPHAWSVTSDSIAARLASCLRADELVLLKSQDPPPHSSLAKLASCGYVDAWFPRAAEGLAVRCVNLRSCGAGILRVD
jgi:aspartokinase-like uncharacterized kinase